MDHHTPDNVHSHGDYEPVNGRPAPVYQNTRYFPTVRPPSSSDLSAAAIQSTNTDNISKTYDHQYDTVAGSPKLLPYSYLQDQISLGLATPTNLGSEHAAAAAAASTGGSESGAFCSYMEDCTTGTPLRKVVSHIFGRDKTCTRQIPRGVWLCYCRKHYQRSRSRNPNGFALLQYDLVRKQVDRLQVWGGFSDWIVKLRKREEVRLSRENTGLGATDPSEGEAAVEEEEEENRRRSTPARASAWLRQSLGEGKSTAEVLEVLARIEHEIRESGSNSFPDVEILPNIINTQAPRWNPRATPSDQGYLERWQD